MAGNIKTNSVTLGDSATDSQNFQLRTNADGTATLARGAAGNLGDILTVDAGSLVNFPTGLTNGTVKQGNLASDALGTALLSATGYQKFPSGLIIQWGGVAFSPPATTVEITYPISFTVATFQVVISQSDGVGVYMGKYFTTSLTGFTAHASQTGFNASWIAIGV